MGGDLMRAGGGDGRIGGKEGAAERRWAASGLAGGGAGRPHTNKRARRSCLLGHPRCLFELSEKVIKNLSCLKQQSK